MTDPRPTNPAEYEAAKKRVTPQPAEFRPGVWSVPLPLREALVPYTLCYLLLDNQGGVHLIDPGADSVENWKIVNEVLQQAGRSMTDVASVVVTHLHFDHIGMADRIREASGARVVMHRFEQEAIDRGYGTVSPNRADLWGVPSQRREELLSVARERASRVHTQADELVVDGDRLVIPSRDVQVVWTPGHTYGHICLVSADDDLVFTGDHVLPMLYPGLGLGGSTQDNPIADYLAALGRISTFDALETCPGHGYRFRGLADRCEATAAHHRRRTADVAAVLDRLSFPTVWEVAATVTWSAGWDGLHGYALDSALSQTAMHVEFLGRNNELALIRPRESGGGLQRVVE